MKQEHPLNSFILPAATLWQRELVRFWRQRSRVLSVVASPLVFWLLIGYGSNDLARYYSGTLVLTVMFSAIFSTISIIEDRREGFLQGVLVAPIPRWAMVLGKVLGGTFVALVQGLIFLVLGLTLPIVVTPLAALELVLLLFVASLAVTSLGTFFAWQTDSTQGFHAIMNLVLMPLWLLSGGFFPAPVLATSAGWSQWLLGAAMRLNPLSYAVGGVRRLLAPAAEYPEAWVPGLAMSWLVTLAFAAAAFSLAVWVSRQRTSGDLQ
jgi:ABC-2 type transport system permease protein